MQFRSIYHAYHRGLKSARITSAVEHLARSRSTDSACLILVKLCPGWQQLPDAWWPLLQQMARSAVAPSAAELAPLIDLRQANLMSAPDWLRLSSMLIALRNFHLASQVRELAKERIRHYMSRPDRALYCDLAIGLALEDWNPDNLKSQLRIARWLRTECGRNRANPLLASLVSNETSSHYDAADQPYASYLKGRSVAVIGPLEISPDALDEIAGFNLTVGINDIRPFSGQNDSDLIHPNIIYLVGSVQQKMRDKELLSERQPPQFIVGKHRSPGYTAQGPHSNYRAIPQYNHFILNGSLNMLPRVVLDLAFFGPERIKVFGANLYTSRNYRNDYGGGAHESDETILRQHIAHDLITQYRLLRNLFLNGHFQADAQLENVLNMGLENYLGIFQGSAAKA